jgi:hypothetical protein
MFQDGRVLYAKENAVIVEHVESYPIVVYPIVVSQLGMVQPQHTDSAPRAGEMYLQRISGTKQGRRTQERIQRRDVAIRAVKRGARSDNALCNLTPEEFQRSCEQDMAPFAIVLYANIRNGSLRIRPTRGLQHGRRLRPSSFYDTCQGLATVDGNVRVG